MSFTNSSEAKKIDVCHGNHIIKSALGLLGNENSHSRKMLKKLNEQKTLNMLEADFAGKIQLF